MPKPTTTSQYTIDYVLEGESKVQIYNLEKGGKSYSTIAFPAGTKVMILVSKYPEIEETK